MKQHIILLIIVGIFSSFIRCKNDNAATEKHGNQAVKPPVTTLDSLQGTWVSSLDTLYRINISGATKTDYYENELNSTTTVFIANDCANPVLSSYNQSQVDGTRLIQYTSGNTNYDFCYKIGYLSDVSLELYYDGKHLSFHKQ